MWALAVAALAAAVDLGFWFRSGLTWRDFWRLRVCRVYSILWHRCRANRRNPFPGEGPAIVVVNHTCSADPMFLLGWTNRPLSFVVAREHFHLSGLAHGILTWLRCVPVTRGGHDAIAARTALRRLSEGCVLCIFPEGNLSGVVRNRLQPGRPGAALIALRSRAPVYPVYIAGGPRTEKLLRSWVYPSRVAVRVIFGQPVDLSCYYGRPINRKTLEEVTALFMRHIAALRPRTCADEATLSCQTKRLP